MKFTLPYLLLMLFFLSAGAANAQVQDTLLMDFYSNQLLINGKKVYPVVKDEYIGEVKTILLEISLPNSIEWRREDRAVKSYHKGHLGRICQTIVPGVNFAINLVLDTTNHDSYQRMFVRQEANGIPELVPVLQPYVDASLMKEPLKEELYLRLVYFGYLNHRSGRKIKFNRAYEDAIMTFSRHFHDYAGYPYVHLQAVEVLLDQTIL
jgi:hypothetical protein